MLAQHCLTTYARHHGGTFIIRIEDTDRKRHVEGLERSQRKPSLVGHGLGWPETHENTASHRAFGTLQKYIDQLLAEGKAYRLTLQKKSWQRNVNAKQQVKHLAISMNTLV